MASPKKSPPPSSGRYPNKPPTSPAPSSTSPAADKRSVTLTKSPAPPPAAAILWPLSEEASYITGAILDVAGGR